METLRAVHRRGGATLFAQSFCVAVTTPLLMRLPLARVEAILEHAAALSRSRSEHPDDVAATVLDMLQVARPLVRRGCLTRGLTLYYGLRRAGVDAELDFGLGPVPDGDGFDGHCWLVLDGKPYLEPRDPRSSYTTTYSFRGGARRASVAAKAPTS